MSKQAFEKYINPKSPAKIKEEYRQEKRKIKAEMRAEGEELRRIKAAKLRGEQTEENSFRDKKSFSDKDYPKGKKFTPDRQKEKKYNSSDERRSEEKPFRERKNFPAKDRPKGKDFSADRRKDNKYNSSEKPVNTAFQRNEDHKKTKNYGIKNERFAKEKSVRQEEMPLNKFIAHSGVCGRREAAELVKQGFVKVNGDIVYEPAVKVSEEDNIELKGKRVALQVKPVYILMNKPKDHITTTKDEKGRKTVLDLLKGVDDVKRIYPVGRLDRNTTGVLLLTNDGELAQKLTHPSFEIKKIYEVSLDKPLQKKDAEAIANGIGLEDGFIKADAIGYVGGNDKSLVGIEIHSGRNRIVRRIFEHLGYEVKKLDRVMFANLTKKNVERGRWRYLSEKEIRLLKYMNASMQKKASRNKKEQAD